MGNPVMTACEKAPIGLFRFLDWVSWLPEDLGAEFDAKMVEPEDAREVEYAAPSLTT